MNQTVQQSSQIGFREFVCLMAFIMCMVALSVDAMLPGLSQMSGDLQVANANDIQYVISFLFVGVAFGQLFYGPFADAKGRKPAVYFGFALFLLGTLISMIATNLEFMLFGRFLQGLGAAGPRIITVAIVRDLHKGPQMARVMSLIMAIFILCPVVAPLLGQLVLFVADWRAIFGMLLVLSTAALFWFALRLTETLTEENRRPFSWKMTKAGSMELLTHRISMAYIVGLGLIFGAFLGFINSVQQILQGIYLLGAAFPLYFAMLAFAIGFASFVNSKLVMRFGLKSLVMVALVTITVLSALSLPVAYLYMGTPPLWMLLLYLLIILFCIGLLFGNLNALAMEPFGHIAGVASGLVGALSTLIAVALGALVGQAFNDTVLPMVAGFAIIGALSAATVMFATRA